MDFFDKYKSQIKDSLDIDDFIVELLKQESLRLTNKTIISQHLFVFYSLLSIITNFLYKILGISRNINNGDDDFVFLSCPDTIFRTKTIHLIASNLKYKIIYLPNFHIFSAIKYYKYFKSKNIESYFPTVKISYILDVRRKVNNLIRLIGDKSIKNDRVISVISVFLIYDCVVKGFINKINSNNTKWILEHQKFYFLSAVSNIRRLNMKSTMLQHGIFFQPVYDFIPLICDDVLCCSEREKQLYINSGLSTDNVHVLGAPLQTLQTNDNYIDYARHYSILVLLTEINDSNIYLISEVLNYIKHNYSNVLVRLRPRSSKNDKMLLGNVLNGLELSNRKSKIYDDINQSDKIISFSVDANIEVVKCCKPFVYIWDGESDDSLVGLNIATIDNYKIEIDKLITSEFYSTFTKNQYKQILGETDTKILRERFVRYIKK